MNTKKRSRLPLSLWGTSIVLILAATTLNGFAQQVSVPPTKLGFADVPPGTESATLQLLDTGGTALLELDFDDKDERVGRGVPIVVGGKRHLLRDDGLEADAKPGDGIFSAVVEVEPKSLVAQAEFAINTSGKTEPRPIFRGREMIGVEDANAVEARFKRLVLLQNVERLVRDRVRIDLFDLVPLIDPASILPENSLMITDPQVVQDPSRTVDPCTGAGDPNGVWTFKHLVTEMVGSTGVDPSDFVENWLKLWLTPQLVSSGFVAAPRPAMLAKIINPWPRLPNGKLDLDQSPMRLSAIVNRIDLKNNATYGGGNAGEGRFIFGIVDRTVGGCAFMPFSIIFEYGIPISGCENVKSWANQWINLSSLVLGSPAYNDALAAITEQFVTAGAAPRKPNGSALNQLRTNENALNFLWELREFGINRVTHLLFEDTVKQTPDETLNNTVTFANYVNGTAIPHVVPERFPGLTPFMGATSRASVLQLDTHFKGPVGLITLNSKRHEVSLAACASCHIRETGTVGSPAGNNAFLHVDPQFMPAPLSRFLTGASPLLTDPPPDSFVVTDPVVITTFRRFNDLELRRQLLASIAGSDCISNVAVATAAVFQEAQRPIGPRDPLPPIRDLRVNSSVNIPNLSPH